VTSRTVWQYARLRGRYQPADHSWKYDWVSPDGAYEAVTSGDLEQLNRAGAEGWELVVAQVDERLVRYTFKRPVPDPAG
jgi:hypothetical protein